MDNYYSLLGIEKNASQREIKKAFRERAKLLHPDIAGDSAEEAMRRLLAAYEALSSRERRFEYDRALARFSESFDYPVFLRERKNDPASQAKLVFYLLLHQEGKLRHVGPAEYTMTRQFDPVEIWTENGGLDFHLEKYLEREDYMDCTFLLAEELDRRDRVNEAFSLMAGITSQEKLAPYFKHFMEDVKIFHRKLGRKLKQKEKSYER